MNWYRHGPGIGDLRTKSGPKFSCVRRHHLGDLGGIAWQDRWSPPWQSQSLNDIHIPSCLMLLRVRHSNYWGHEGRGQHKWHQGLLPRLSGGAWEKYERGVDTWGDGLGVLGKEAVHVFLSPRRGRVV